MPILAVDLCICSTATMDGGLTRLIECLLMKLDTFLMLPMNTLLANAPKVTVKVLVLVGMATAKTAHQVRPAVSWIQMI